jgi:hypothetical protein
MWLKVLYGIDLKSSQADAQKMTELLIAEQLRRKQEIK